jgi:hypothetical protein
MDDYLKLSVEPAPARPVAATDWAYYRQSIESWSGISTQVWLFNHLRSVNLR